MTTAVRRPSPPFSSSSSPALVSNSSGHKQGGDAMPLKLHSLTSMVTGNPIALRIGDVVIFYYGLFMGTAFCVAIAAALFHISQSHNDDALQAYFTVMCYCMFPSAILGARLFSWILEDKFNPKLIFRPGFYWHGGLLGTMIGCGIGYHYFLGNLSLAALLDGFGLATPAFEIFNRMGCLSYGCCWGKVLPATHPHAICYTNHHSCIHRKQEPTRHQWRYPVQCYAIVLSILQLSLLLPVSSMQNLKAIKLQPGCLFLLSMTLSSVVRLICEKYRGDPRGEGSSSTSFFALVQGVVAVAYWGLSSLLWGGAALDQESDSIASSNPGVLIVDNAGTFVAIFLTAMIAYGTMTIPKTAQDN